MPKTAALAIALLSALPTERMSSCVLLDIATTFTEAHAVFVGRVIETSAVRNGPGSHDVQTLATFKVERLWKGPLSPRLQVVSCGVDIGYGKVVCPQKMQFQPGVSYLVIAYGEPLLTSECSTKRTEDSVDELLWLASKPSRRLPD